MSEPTDNQVTEPKTMAIAVEQSQLLTIIGLLSDAINPMIVCDCRDSEVDLLRKMLIEANAKAREAAVIVDRLIDGVPF